MDMHSRAKIPEKQISVTGNTGNQLHPNFNDGRLSYSSYLLVHFVNKLLTFKKHVTVTVYFAVTINIVIKNAEF